MYVLCVNLDGLNAEYKFRVWVTTRPCHDFSDFFLSFLPFFVESNDTNCEILRRFFAMRKENCTQVCTNVCNSVKQTWSSTVKMSSFIVGSLLLPAIKDYNGCNMLSYFQKDTKSIDYSKI